VSTAEQQTTAAPDVDFASNGNAFLRVCEPPGGTNTGHSHIACIAYIVGVGDGAELMSERSHQRLYCPGPDVENGQKYRIVVKYIKEHPERTDLQTRILIVDALIATFPCHAAK